MFSEILYGLPIIRCFKQEKRFNKKYYRVIDNNIKTLFWNESLESWFGLKLQFLAVCVTMPMVIMVLIDRETKDNPSGFKPSLGGLFMTFSVSFDVCTFYTFIFTNMIQIRLISFERLMNYLDIIQEKQGEIKSLEGWPSKGEIRF